MLDRDCVKTGFCSCMQNHTGDAAFCNSGRRFCSSGRPDFGRPEGTLAWLSAQSSAHLGAWLDVHGDKASSWLHDVIPGLLSVRLEPLTEIHLEHAIYHYATY